LHFTDVGAQQIRYFTGTEGDVMIALVVDGTLMLALPVRSEIGKSALISGNMAQVEIDRLYAMLAATEVRKSPDTPGSTHAPD
jgi:hypothetical protein